MHIPHLPSSWWQVKVKLVSLGSSLSLPSLSMLPPPPLRRPLSNTLDSLFVSISPGDQEDSCARASLYGRHCRSEQS